MQYLFKVKLCGYICDNCSEPLSNIKISLYSRIDEKAATLAAAEPKTTYAQLTDDEIRNNASHLLTGGKTDDEGKVDLLLDEKYNGQAFDVVIHIDGPGREETRHFHLTTLAPTWREYKDQMVAVWDHCLSQRIWCLILAILGRWVICGHVVHCKTKQPIGGVRVSAFDRDWLQDDPLGNAITDINGRFLIAYTKADFKTGTWIDVELFGGPDLYFHVHHLSGAPLLIEDQSKGREAGRENVGNCFCVTLCLEKGVEQEEDYPPPVFTHVGGYNHQTEIDSSPGASGLTSADGRAFYETIRLNGTLPKKFDGGQMEYRFDFREMQPNGTPINGWTPIDMANMPSTVIGQLLKYAPVSPSDPNPIKSEDYTVNGGASEPSANIAAGWVQVPQENDTFDTTIGYFQPNGNQIKLDTKKLGGWVDLDMSGLVAGNSSAPIGLAQNRYFSLRMRVRRVGNPASEQVAGVCEQIAINNTLYDNVLQHPAWMAENLSDQLGVVTLDIQQLIVGGGCAEIGNDLDVKFTAAHPTLGNVWISMSGPGGPYSFTLPAPVAGEQYGTATPNGFVVADLDPCSYLVTLRVQLLLTNGDLPPNDRYDQIAFCKA